MSKIIIGDYVYHEHHNENGTVINDRGGHVGRWIIQADNGKTYHASSRDLTVIKRANQPKQQTNLSADDKIDLLLKHFGLEIRVEPEVIEIVEDEKTSD